MAGFDHQPMPQAAEEPRSPRNARYGLILFAVYLVLYGAFVLINAFAPKVMEATPLGGINLAVLSGMGLILAAFVLALLYAWLCSRAEVASFPVIPTSKPSALTPDPSPLTPPPGGER